VTLLSLGAGPKLNVVTSWLVLLLCEYTAVLTKQSVQSGGTTS